MPYQRISWSHIADPEKKAIIHRADLLLGDVYTMCCKHPLKRTKAGGCNFSAVLVLVCIIDALAGHVYTPTKCMPERRGVQGRRFKKLIKDKLHWHSSWIRVDQFSSFLWNECRNPLTHAAGLDKNSQHKHMGLDEPVVGFWGDITPQKIAAVDRRKTWPESWPILSPDPRLLRTKTGKPARLQLTIVALYWAVKKLTRDLAN
jgi:hypothetical protein